MWLLYYYSTLALREQILRVNGSNINEWWIFHHYFAILTSMTIVTWHWESASYQEFYPMIMLFGVFQGVAQVLMNVYQIGRLYNLVARGEASRMDVTAEILDHRFAVSMGVLLPFLLFMNGFMIYISVSALNYAWQLWPHTEWQILAIGFLFVIFASGNLRTTVSSAISKAVRVPLPYEAEE